MDTLPNEVLQDIFNWLPMTKRQTIHRVCSLWSILESLIKKPSNINNLELIYTIPYNFEIGKCFVYENKWYSGQDKYYYLDNMEFKPSQLNLPTQSFAVSNDEIYYCENNCLVIYQHNKTIKYDSYWKDNIKIPYPIGSWTLVNNSNDVYIFCSNGTNYRMEILDNQLRYVSETKCLIYDLNSYKVGFDEQYNMYTWTKTHVTKYSGINQIQFKTESSQFNVITKINKGQAFVELIPRTESIPQYLYWFDGFLYSFATGSKLEVYQTYY